VSNSLLKLQLGPVQEFIAQARSTRDLWSGSYLLSWLMAAGIAKLLECGGTPIYPSAEDQPLIDYHQRHSKSEYVLPQDHLPLLTPNIPNVFVAHLSVETEDAKKIAIKVEEAIRAEWMKIIENVWGVRGELGIKENRDARFKHQVKHFLSISWQVTPQDQDYAEAYKRTSWLLDAVRQTRIFEAWGEGKWQVVDPKDSLSGKEESIAGGKDFTKWVSPRFKHLFKHDDYLGAISLVKRIWHLVYLADKKNLKTNSTDFPIPSTRAIASRNRKENEAEIIEDLAGEKYFAVLALDGDQIGKWISGDLCDLDRDHHENFSRSLGKFALGEARKIVESENHKGRLIYAGGDDVLALLPADTVLDCARELRKKFLEATKRKDKKDNDLEISPDCSVGICMAHFKSPLQDVIREAQSAEKRAKRDQDQGGYGRSAVAVTLMKRSGEISHWGCKWDKNGDKGGLALYGAIDDHLSKGSLSGKFPHRVCELLEPYLNAETGLSKMEHVNDFDESASQVIEIEFVHTAQRQGSNNEIAEQLKPLLAGYLKGIVGTQEQLRAIIGLCTTIAFATRNRPPRTELLTDENKN